MAQKRLLRRKAKTPAAVVDQPRMRAIYAAALKCQGRVVDMVRELGVTRRWLHHRLSILRREEVGAWYSLWDPRKVGWPVESVVLLRASRIDPESLIVLEALIRDDAHITNAVQVSGDFDYRLVTFHRDRAEAVAWRHALAQSPLILSISQRFVETQFGDTLAGLRLDVEEISPSG